MKPEKSQLEKQRQQQESLTQRTPTSPNLKILKRYRRTSSSDEDAQSAKNARLFTTVRTKESNTDKIKGKLADLLKDGADINAQNASGKTILHIAIEKDYKDIVEFLLKQKGIVSNIRNKDDRTALDLAEHLDRQGIVQILASHDQPVADMPEGVMPKKIKLATSVQKSPQKRKASPHNDVRDNSKRGKLDSEEDDESPKSLKTNAISAKENTYHKGGLVHSLHGNIYQLKLQMLFLKRALDKGYEFNLGTEVEDAEKFDDIVFKYKRKDESGKAEIRFIQAKHKQDESRKITANDLLKAKDDDFSLKKYFISYCGIKKKPTFSGYELKDFILCTNINFDFADLEKASIKTEKIKENDDILEVTKSGKAITCYKLIIPKKHKLYETLRETSDMHVLVKALKQHILEDKPLQLGADIFKLYHGPLSKEIFDISLKEKENNEGKKVTKRYAKFRADFLTGNNLSEEVSNFRNVLQSALELKDNDQFQQELSPKELAVSAGFGQVFELQTNPTITDSKGLAEKIAQIVIEAQKKQEYIITIERKADVIKSNINKLAFHILVQDEAQKGLIRFRKTFFDDNQKLQGNLEEFRAALKVTLEEQGLDFGALSQYKYKISEFNTCEETPEGELLYSKDGLPNYKIEDAEIKEFLEKLVFAVNQPNEVKLGEIITQEIGTSSKFNLLDANLVSDSFQRKMLDWFKEKHPEKGKEGVWLDARSGQEFLDSIEKKVSGLISVGLSVAYPEKLATYGIRFGINNLFKKLKAFLSNESASKKIFHIITPEETILSAINVYGALEVLKKQEEFAQYEKNDSYIFIRLSTLLGQKTLKYVMDAFKSKDSHNLLIIDCKTAAPENDIQRLYEELSDILLKTCKKIILIAKEHNTLIDRFSKDLKYNVADNTSFGDLTKKSKEILLEKEVTFQGETVSLKQLCFKPVDGEQQLDTQLNQLNIDPKTLIKLIKGDEISISSKVRDLGEINDYYVDRRLRPVIFSKEKIKKDLERSRSKSDLFVISGADSGLKGNNIYVFDNKDESVVRKFNELCEQKPGYNIHWLESHSGKLTWCRSHGSISNIVRYRIIEKVDEIDNTRSARLIEEDKLIHKDNHHKIIIISDTAGMGKSTVLTSLSMKLKKDSSLWVVRINLNDYTKALNEELNNRKSSKLKFSDQDINKVVNFLLNDLLASQEQSKLTTNLEKELFNNSFNNRGKIALLFDGFDEISPDYKDIVIDLLQSLKKCKVEKLFVTTRPNMSDELEQALEVFSHVLEPLSKKEQIQFLTKFWTKKLERKNLDKKKYTERLKTYAESIIEHISKSIHDKEQGFISIPLQTMMLAEVFQENQGGTPATWQGCKEFLESEHDKPNLTNDFALLDLYEHFVKRKFYKFYLEEKKGRDFTKVGETKSADKAYKIFKEKHAILALHTLFSKKKLKELSSLAAISKLKSLIADIKSAEHSEGIVDQIIDDKPHFIHRTFAEYFASFPIAKKMLATPADTLQWIDSALLNTSPIFINGIIEQLDGKQEKITSVLKKPLLHFVIIRNHSNFIKSLVKVGCNDWAKKLDASGKTPLHYAIQYNHFNIVKELLDYANDIYENNILKHGSFKRPEYENSRLVKFINVQDKFGMTALHYAIQKNDIDFAFELLLKGASIDTLPDADVNRLIRKMLYAESNDLYNGNILAVYADQDNKYRPIQEKLLLKTPGIFNELNVKDQCRILSYFFVHGRIKVIKALLGTIGDLEQRTKILNTGDNCNTPLDRVNCSDKLSDDDRLEITKYLLEHGGIQTKNSCVGYSWYNDSPNCYITMILQAAIKYGHIKTFKYFISQENRDYYYLHLNYAMEHKQYIIVKCLFDNDKEIIEGGNTALHIACHDGAKLKIIKYLIDNGEINATNDAGETPLFKAIYGSGELNVIEYLVNKGSNVNWIDAFGNTPLSRALENNQVDIINYLLKKDARISEKASQLIKDKVALLKDPSQYDLDLVDENGFPRLHTAIKSGNFEWAKFLVRHGADVNKVDKQGKAPLHWASALNQVKIVELLLQYGAVFDKKDSDNSTPRDLLPEPCNHSKIIWLLDVLDKLFSSQDLMQDLNKQLLKVPGYSLKDWGPYGCGIPDAWDNDNPMLFIVNARNNQGKTLLHIAAAETNDQLAVNLLFKFNRDYLREKFRGNLRCEDYQSTSVDVRDSQGNAPLHLAAQNGHGEVVSWLLEKGAIFNGRNSQGDTPEVLAANNKHNNIVKLLQPTKNLFIAVEENNKVEVGSCIKGRAYINARNQSGKTPLHLAASFGQLDVVQLLLNNNADVEAVDLEKNTPLHIAAEKDEIENVKLLLKYRAIYNAKNAQGQRPLELAHGQSYELLKQIDTLFKDVQSDDPQVCINNLEMMCKNSETDICTIINTCDNHGNTPLHYAAESCEFNIVKSLLENGAIFNAENKFKKTPIELTSDENITTLLDAIANMFNAVDNIYQEEEKVGRRIIINVRDDAGKGLLHHAAESDDLDMVEFLVEKGADVSLIDIQRLRSSRDPEDIDYLEGEFEEF